MQTSEDRSEEELQYTRLDTHQQMASSARRTTALAGGWECRVD
jgi:hypothetical protein